MGDNFIDVYEVVKRMHMSINKDDISYTENFAYYTRIFLRNGKILMVEKIH